jgi:hypothetical protein
MICSTTCLAVRSLLLLSTAILAAAAGIATFAAEPPAGRSEIQAGEYRIAAPVTHDNLNIYLIFGADRLAGKQYITLQEAMDRSLIKVYETGTVNQLAIENISKDQEVYVQSGDIVKGGRQDRTIAMDFICPPGAKLPVDAFCVEAGRWRQRGAETASQFGSSSYQVAGNALKVAVKGSGEQSEVWRQVDLLQKKASSNVGASVNAAESASSLQLSLENKKLGEMVEQYIKVLASSADKPGVIGYAFSVNGKVRSADVYGSHALFLKLWPKLLRATAVEAVADMQKGKTFEPPALEAVKGFVEGAEAGKSSDRQVTERVRMVTRESEEHLLYETQDKAASAAARAPAGEWIHRNYLAKDDETKAALRARGGRGVQQSPSGINAEPRQLNRDSQFDAPNRPPNPAGSATRPAGR